MSEIKSITLTLPSELKTRLEAREYFLLVERMSAREQLIFDFTQVQFVGRSFADEFYNLFLKRQDKRIAVINEAKEIKKIFQTVQATQHKEKRSDNASYVIEFKNIDDLSAFMCSL